MEKVSPRFRTITPMRQRLVLFYNACYMKDRTLAYLISFYNKVFNELCLCVYNKDYICWLYHNDYLKLRFVFKKLILWPFFFWGMVEHLFHEVVVH